MDNKIPYWKVKIQCQLKLAGDKVKDAARNVGCWIRDHPAEAGAIATGVIGAGKWAYKEKRRHDERMAIECRVYDRRSDTYRWMKRPLKPAEKFELERRYKNGELKSEVLREKGLLKY